MNLQKVEKHLKAIGEQFETDLPTSKEFLVIYGNLLRRFAAEHISKDERFKDLNIDDANAVSLACIAYPEYIPLAILLQAHVVIKFSENFV